MFGYLTITKELKDPLLREENGDSTKHVGRSSLEKNKATSYVFLTKFGPFNKPVTLTNVNSQH